MSLAGAGLLAAVLVLAGQSESLGRVWANRWARSKHAYPAVQVRTSTPLQFDTPIDLDVPVGGLREFHFTLQRDAFVGVTLVTEHGACLRSSIDRMEYWELLDRMPAGVGNAELLYQSPQKAQVFLQAGKHTLTVGHPWEFEWPCPGVLYVYELGLPEGKAAKRVAIGSTYNQTLAAGTVNLHHFQVTNAPRTVAIYVIPAQGSRLKPVVRLYGPDGLPMAMGVYHPATGDTRLSGMMLAVNGDYTLTVQDWEHATGGSYRLAIAGAPALVMKVGQARREYLPEWGPHDWTVIVAASDVAGGEVDCVVYSLVKGQPAPHIVGAIHSVTGFMSRGEIATQPGSYNVSVVNISEQDPGLYHSGGAYIFGCANVEDSEIVYSDGAQMIGIGGELDYYGDGFTRFLPALASSSASFSVKTENNQRMALELWYGQQLVARAVGSQPSFQAAFPQDGVYMLVERAAPGTTAEIVDQTVSIQWLLRPPPPVIQLPPNVLSTPTMAPTPTPTRTVRPTATRTPTPTATRKPPPTATRSAALGTPALAWGAQAVEQGWARH